MASLLRTRALTSFSQMFSPAKVIFVVTCVLLLVGLSLIFIVQPILTCGVKDVNASQRILVELFSRIEYFLPSARDLYRGVTYCATAMGGHNCRNYGRGTEHHWDGDQGGEAGSNEPE